MEAEVPAQRAASGVLADRMAAALVHREPGWQLPRLSALARKYNVSLAEIDAAIGELARRSLIRRLPGGPVAISTAYVPGVAAEPAHPSPGTFDDVLHMPPAGFAEADNASPRAAVIELAPSQPAVARGLRLLPGESAISVTIRFDNRATGLPVGLTAVTMKPQYFRVVIQTGDPLPRDLHPPEPWAATVPSPRPPAPFR